MIMRCRVLSQKRIQTRHDENRLRAALRLHEAPSRARRALPTGVTVKVIAQSSWHPTAASQA